jgi:nitrate/nitrite-specific signal transduction histidine kinase
MTYRTLKMFTVLLPTVLIGGFEYIRHEFLLDTLTMEAGNLYITLLTLVLSFLFATWLFNKLQRISDSLAKEQAKRAVYEERERLAQELHDGIAQTLFFLNVKLKQGKLDEARAAVSSIDHQVRQAIFNLRALPEESASLKLRLQKWLDEFTTMTGIETTLKFELQDDHFAPCDNVHLFGIVQEAFSNIRKHSGAKHAFLSLSATQNGGWEMIIKDDGRGMKLPEDRRRSYGLAMMEERAQKISAIMDIREAQGGGTELVFTSTKGAGAR